MPLGPVKLVVCMTCSNRDGIEAQPAVLQIAAEVDIIDRVCEVDAERRLDLAWAYVCMHPTDAGPGICFSYDTVVAVKCRLVSNERLHILECRVMFLFAAQVVVRPTRDL